MSSNNPNKQDALHHESTVPSGEETPSKKLFTRRNFLKAGAATVVTGGIAVAIAYPNRYAILTSVQSYMANRQFDPSSFIFIPTQGPIQLVCHRSEMGQGVRTALPMILADELEVPWEQIKVTQGLADPRYGSQNTDGSTSVKNFYTRLRQAAAGTRELLVQAAAKVWGVPLATCYAKDGKVHHKGSNRTVAYGELVKELRGGKLPSNPTLKSPKDFKIIGTPRKGIDVPDIVQGKAIFGADVLLPDLVYACAVRAPVPGSRIKSIQADEAKKIKGVLQIIPIEAIGAPVNSKTSVCVVASNTWAAIQGQRALRVDWDTKGLKLDSSEAYQKELTLALQKANIVHRNDGDARGMEAKSKKVTKHAYHTPFLVHAPMEPLVSTAHIKKDGTCEVWAPTQDPMRAKNAIAKFLKIPLEKITLHITMLGGGFGRKSQPDFVLESVALAKKLGKPVRLQWTREDEIQHGFYHAEALQEISAAIDEHGMPLSWHHRAVYPTLLNVMMPGNNTPLALELNMGAINVPYSIQHVLCEAGKTTTPVNVGWFRSVCNIFHAFAVNSFVDELAHDAKIDPVAYRLKLLGPHRKIKSHIDTRFDQDTARLSAVIQKTRDAFGWEKPLPQGKGYGRGFASHYSFNSYVAMALEVRVESGMVHVTRVVCTIDCGLAVNPEGVRAQMEGATIFGLSSALYGKITLKDGVIQQHNFHDYPILRMPETPQIEVHIINGEPERPTGVGEPGVPVVAPALASAVFQATGIRIRALPIAEKLLQR
ncbi:MAG: xanthine dehydrogenase family protein molybdopterin-binding subunit [Myxococcales bacterium]|nr:xanthine dehydrogenase family protein molybdopterin-binding subunit [Myxococcales bacterium]